MKVEASIVKGVKRPRESAAPDVDEPERKNMKRPKNQVRGTVSLSNSSGLVSSKKSKY